MEINLSVKDKFNLVSHNQWSAGEYLNNTTGFSHVMGGTFSISDEYKTIGHKSLKSTRGDGKASIDLNYIVTDAQIGKTGTVSFDAYSASSRSEADLIFRDGSSSGAASIKSSVVVPSDESTHVIFTIPEIQSTTYSVVVRLLNNSGDIFADNFVLKLD